MKIIFLILFVLLSYFENYAQIVNIPDTNFKEALIHNIPVIDTNGDGEIQFDEALSYTDSLIVAFKGIQSITGIEAFNSITYLDCSRNSIHSLDVWNNLKLKYIDCSMNALTTLVINTVHDTELEYLNCSYNSIGFVNVDKCTSLTYLNCSNNYISSLNVNNNPALLYLDCTVNQISTLNIDNNINLLELYCSWNSIMSLDLNNNVNLTKLYCYDNQLTYLDPGNTVLMALNCDNNKLINLDVGNLTTLEELNCSYNNLNDLNVINDTALKVINCNINNLVNLDLSTNIALIHLSCNNNQLLTLNVKNGNNHNFEYFDGCGSSYYYLYALNNPDLYCIQVDDSLWSYYAWPNIDSQSYFSENCYYGFDEPAISACKIAPNPFTENLMITLPPNVVQYDIYIYDMFGKLMNVPYEKSDINIKINGASLKSGIYIIEIISKESLIERFKVVKQ